LSIALAPAPWTDFPHGVHFVSLAAIRDPALAPVAQALLPDRATAGPGD